MVSVVVMRVVLRVIVLERGTTRFTALLALAIVLVMVEVLALVVASASSPFSCCF